MKAEKEARSKGAAALFPLAYKCIHKKGTAIPLPYFLSRKPYSPPTFFDRFLNGRLFYIKNTDFFSTFAFHASQLDRKVLQCRIG